MPASAPPLKRGMVLKAKIKLTASINNERLLMHLLYEQGEAVMREGPHTTIRATLKTNISPSSIESFTQEKIQPHSKEYPSLSKCYFTIEEINGEKSLRFTEELLYELSRGATYQINDTYFGDVHLDSFGNIDEEGNGPLVSGLVVKNQNNQIDIEESSKKIAKAFNDKGISDPNLIGYSLMAMSQEVLGASKADGKKFEGRANLSLVQCEKLNKEIHTEVRGRVGSVTAQKIKLTTEGAAIFLLAETTGKLSDKAGNATAEYESTFSNKFKIETNAKDVIGISPFQHYLSTPVIEGDNALQLDVIRLAGKDGSVEVNFDQSNTAQSKAVNGMIKNMSLGKIGELVESISKSPDSDPSRDKKIKKIVAIALSRDNFDSSIIKCEPFKKAANEIAKEKPNFLMHYIVNYFFKPSDYFKYQNANNYLNSQIRNSGSKITGALIKSDGKSDTNEREDLDKETKSNKKNDGEKNEKTEPQKLEHQGVKPKALNRPEIERDSEMSGSSIRNSR